MYLNENCKVFRGEQVMKKILVIRGSSIGDIVKYLPVASAIKTQFGKECEVHWLVRKKFNKILEGNRFIDKILYYEDYKDLQFRIVKRIYRRRSNISGLSKWLRFSCVNKLKHEHYDAVVNLHEILDAKIFTQISSAPNIVDFPSIVATFDVHRNATLEALQTLRFLDETFDENNFAKKPIDYGWNFSVAELSKTENILKANGCDKNEYIVFVLGTTWESKNYPVENWIKLTELLQKDNIKIVCVGDAKDKDVLNEIKSKSSNEMLIDLIGKTSLREMIIVLNKAEVVVGGDTGPLHIAASLNVNTVTLMNPTSTVMYAPFNNKGTVLTANYDCKNCHKVKCPKGICCMKYIAPEDVASAIIKSRRR